MSIQKTDQPHVPRRQLLFLCLCLVVLALALWARLANLGEHSFWTDEMYHVIAAQSINDGGEPHVPAKGLYTRALPVTYLTAWSFKIFGESELAGRLPFVVISLFMCGLMLFVLRRWFGITLAVIATLILMLMPHELQAAREVRMYALFQLLYFLAAVLLFEGLEFDTQQMPDQAGTSMPRRTLRFRVGLLLSGALVLVFAFYIQPLAINFLVSALAYCVCMGIGRICRGEWSRVVRSRHGVVLLIALGCAVIVWAFVPHIIRDMFLFAREKPAWAKTTDPYVFYEWMLTYFYPALTYLYPLGAVLLILRYGKRGLFMVCLFVPVMSLHMSLYSGRVAERYVVYLLPFFVLPACEVVSIMLTIAGRRIADLWRSRQRPAAAAVAISVLFGLNLLAQPWLDEGVSVIRYGRAAHWKEAQPLLVDLAQDHVVMTPWPREMLWYTQQFPDYVITKGYEDDGSDDHVLSVGDHDYHVRRIRTAERMRQLLEGDEKVLLVTSEWAFYNPDFFDDDMRNLVYEHMTQYYGEDAYDLMVFTREPEGLSHTANDVEGITQR